MPVKKEIDLNRFKELLEKGLSTKELCKIFDIAESSVARAKLKCGYLTKKFQLLTEKISKETLIDLFVNKKMSTYEIAQQFNETRNKIIELMNLYDISQKERKLDISYEELYKDYKENKMTYEQLSKKYGISTHEVAENIHKYNFTSNKFEGEISQKELYDLYIVKNIRANDVAKHFGCSLSTLNEYIKKYGLNKDPEQYHKLAKETCLEKYGVENGGWTEEAQKKIKETNNRKYGVDFYTQTQDFKNKTKKTCKEKYGTEWTGTKVEEIDKKIKQTCLKRYGSIYPIQNESCKEKVKETNLERYSTENYAHTDDFKKKVKETCLNKYNTEWTGNGIPHIHEKIKQTNLKKYGVESYSQTEEYKNKFKNTMQQRYGVDYATQSIEIRNKGYQTKRKNNTFSTSNFEKKVKSLLEEKFPNVKCQYKSDAYPFNCDFYIPELDLYIEIQGYWNHGIINKNKIYGPYDQNNPEHQRLVAKWQQQLNEGHEAYKAAINVWTVTDPLKRQMAKDNGLNWLEFWTFDEFMEWYKQQ